MRPGPYGRPALLAGANRGFVVAGRCGIPPTARAVSVNATATQPSTAGNLTLFAAGSPTPLASTLNYAAGQTRGNNAIAPLSGSGALAVNCSQSTGGVHFILDVDGYFQ